MCRRIKVLRFLRTEHSRVSRDDMSDAVLCKMLMVKMPTEVLTTLSIIFGLSLNDFDAAAGTAMCRFSASSILLVIQNFNIALKKVV